MQQSAGFIRVESRSGAGSQFHVYLPRHVGMAQARSQENSLLASAPPRSTVLLVEDDPSVLALVRTLLQRLGHRVVTAASGQEALSLARQSGQRFDIVMTDVVMPGMNGVDLMASLHAQFPGLPCIFMSGYASDVLPHSRAELSDIVLLSKPFTIAALAQALQEAGSAAPLRAASS